jgi:quinol monooxygenase YgiN
MSPRTVASATVEGFEAFDVYQGDEDPHRFVMVERWASVDAHKHTSKRT